MKLQEIDRIEVDPTFSTGMFYKPEGIIPTPIHCFDIVPMYDFVKKHDCRSLPFDNNSINSIIFDPPFLATKGKSLNTNEITNNIMLRRFSYLHSEYELYKLYTDSLNEFYRVLKYKGTLIFKCQDKVSSGTQYLSHVFIINEAVKIGYYVKDIYILTAKSRLVANWQRVNQKHARKYHAYFLVLEKSNKKVKYVKE
jgi:tRNA G10  N-methylase Trm11